MNILRIGKEFSTEFRILYSLKMGNAQTGAIKRDQTVTEYGIFAYPSNEQGRAEIALKSGTIDAGLLEHLIASALMVARMMMQ